MEKIIIIGSGGSGKSTLARKLGIILDLSVVHLDNLFWKPGWQPTEKEDWIEIQEDLIKNEKWIIDGNYDSTIDLRINASDTIIFLNISKYICIFRAIKRRLVYHNRSRPDLNQGCKEKIDFKFLKWIWYFPKKITPNILKKLSKSRNKRIFILSSKKEIKTFLNNMNEYSKVKKQSCM